jgi:hypothetical protein
MVSISRTLEEEQQQQPLLLLRRRGAMYLPLDCWLRPGVADRYYLRKAPSAELVS